MSILKLDIRALYIGQWGIDYKRKLRYKVLKDTKNGNRKKTGDERGTLKSTPEWGRYGIR